MPSMSKLIVVAVLAVAAAGVPSAYAQDPVVTTAVPVNLDENIVTIVLILGVAIAVTLIYVLSKVIPMCRSGELSFSKIEFDWRAELLNQTPKKEKARRAEEQARREEEMAAANATAAFSENGSKHYGQNEPLSPHRAAVESAAGSERRVQVEVRAAGDDRIAH